MDKIFARMGIYLSIILLVVLALAISYAAILHGIAERASQDIPYSIKALRGPNFAIGMPIAVKAKKGAFKKVYEKNAPNDVKKFVKEFKLEPIGIGITRFLPPPCPKLNSLKLVTIPIMDKSRTELNICHTLTAKWDDGSESKLEMVDGEFTYHVPSNKHWYDHVTASASASVGSDVDLQMDISTKASLGYRTRGSFHLAVEGYAEARIQEPGTFGLQLSGRFN